MLDTLVTRCRFGAFAANEPYPVDPHFALEEEVRSPLPVASWFVAWGSSWPDDAAETLSRRGDHDVLLCWEMHGITHHEVLAGRYDEYIYDFARAAGAYPGSVVVRPMHEGNGNWYDWAPASGRGFSTGPAQWRATWQHVVSVARRAGSANLRFLWCMNNTDVGGVALESLWPGRSYVDLIGVDGYAWTGTGTFDAVIGPAYRRLTALDPVLDVWVPEVGINGQHAHAASFYRSVYDSRRFPRMTTVCWFSTGEFVITDDPASLQVHRQQLPRALRYGGRQPAPARPALVAAPHLA